MFAKNIVPTDHPDVTDHVEAFTKQICEVIVGKTQAVKLAVACLLARGHLLIEDIPGVGKTTLSQALARSLALAFQRIQFTSDLLPADILGNSIFDRTEQRFVFQKSRRFKFDEVRQRFRLTPTERGVAVFVAAAFVLGLVTKCYRDAHPSPTPIERHSTTMKSLSRSTRKKADETRTVKPGDPANRTRNP